METLRSSKLELTENYFSDPGRQQIVRELGGHFAEERSKRNIPADIVTWDDLGLMLTPDEMSIVDQVRYADPRQFGFNGPRIFEDGGGSFVTVEGQTFQTEDGEMRVLPPKFLPPHIHERITRINERAHADGVEPLIVESGYRSPAYQAIVLLNFLSRPRERGGYDFDINETAKRVAFPGYSEHGSWRETAIDITTQSFLRLESSKTNKVRPTELDQTETFRWLADNSQEFGLVLSYPQGNETGIGYEPWHWKVAEDHAMADRKPFDTVSFGDTIMRLTA